MTPKEKDRREGMGVRVCVDESRRAAGAVTGSLTVRHEGKAAGPVAHAGTGSTYRRIPCDEIRAAVVEGATSWVARS